MLKTRFFVIAAVFTVTCSSTVLADAINDRLDSVERTVKSFQSDSVARNEKVASALSSIEVARQEVLAMQGSVDANNHLIREQQKELSRLKRDITERMAAIEDMLELYNIQVSKALAKTLPQAASETEAYQKALNLVQDSDFLNAIAAFRSFLKSYSKSELSDNAQYWIGECYYAMKDYQKAIKEFQVLIDRNPRSEKSRLASLKQAYSFAELGMPDEAKLFLENVIKTYPGSEEALRAKEKLDKLNQKGAVVDVQTLNPSAVQDAHSNIPLAPGVKNQPPKPAEKTPAPVRNKN